MAEWSVRRTRNPAIPGSVSTTTWICSTVALTSNPPVTFVNNQLVCLRPVGILNNVMSNLSYLFRLFAGLL